MKLPRIEQMSLQCECKEMEEISIRGPRESSRTGDRTFQGRISWPESLSNIYHVKGLIVIKLLAVKAKG